MWELRLGSALPPWKFLTLFWISCTCFLFTVSFRHYWKKECWFLMNFHHFRESIWCQCWCCELWAQDWRNLGAIWPFWWAVWPGDSALKCCFWAREFRKDLCGTWEQVDESIKLNLKAEKINNCNVKNKNIEELHALSSRYHQNMQTYRNDKISQYRLLNVMSSIKPFLK